MIEKLEKLQGRDIYENTALAKLNEVIDAVNSQQIQLNNHECRLLDLQNRITALEDPAYHEAPAENVQDKFAEQREWIEKLCWFWDDNKEAKICGILTEIDPENYDYKGQTCPCLNDRGDGYMHCEPVKPDDDVIFKGE